VKLRKRSPKDKGNNWLLIKELDDYMRRGGTPSVETETTSVTSGRSMDEIAQGKRGKAVWHSNRKGGGAAKGDPEIVAGTRKAKRAKSSSAKSSRSKSSSAKPSGSKKNSVAKP